jgi:hypothetical protein
MKMWEEKKSYIENIFSERKKEGDDRVRLERESAYYYVVVYDEANMRIVCVVG